MLTSACSLQAGLAIMGALDLEPFGNEIISQQFTQGDIVIDRKYPFHSYHLVATGNPGSSFSIIYITSARVTKFFCPPSQFFTRITHLFTFPGEY
jgi:hypothetical protein